MYENTLEVKNLEVQYPKNGFHLNPVNFVVPKGKVVGLIGENGSGKTTLMHAILNLRKKTAGSVKLFNKEFKLDDTNVKERIGVSFDDVVLSGVTTANRVSKLHHDLYPTWDDTYFKNTLARFDIGPRKYIMDYSKGMQKLFSIILSMSHQPELLMLDEPTSSLDPVRRVEVLDILRSFISDGEKSILFSSHITTDIEQIADYVLYIHKGKMIFLEPIEKLKTEYVVVRCNPELFEKILKDNEDVLAVQKVVSEYAVLLQSKALLHKLPNNLTVETPTLEQIMNIVARGEVR
jgi:ABC-2 type transport system ATP-binding protein